MKTIEEDVTAQIVEKKSKFISFIYYVSSAEDAENKIKEIRKKHYDARHHCFAYRIYEENNIIEKASDDGEPSGTAGAPMLNLLAKNELVNVLVVVVRYFGGILLGTGGLVRAYTQATQEAVQKVKMITIQPGVEIEITIPYQYFSNFQYYCQKNQINILESKFNENVICVIQVSNSEKERILGEIEESQLNIQNKRIVQETYIKKNTQ